jgi:flagellar hook assembly protein FlgD
VSLKLYDITGRLIRTLASGQQAGGSYAAPWDGKDENGREVSSGVYLYQLKTGGFQSTQRLTLLR